MEKIKEETKLIYHVPKVWPFSSDDRNHLDPSLENNNCPKMMQMEAICMYESILQICIHFPDNIEDGQCEGSKAAHR